MIKHIVLFQLKAFDTDEKKQEKLGSLKRGLDELMGKVPGLLSVEVVKSLSAVSFAVIVELRMSLFVSAVGSGFKNFRREGNLKK